MEEAKKPMGQSMLNLVKDFERLGGLREDEYINDDIIHCKHCNTPRMFVSDDKKFKVRCLCKCQADARDREIERQKVIDEQAKFNKLQKASLLGERYYNVTFENTDLNRNDSFLTAYNRCKKFCENYNEVLKKGYGMYLWGDSGSGKTHLMACMVNELTRNYVPCLFTNFFEIAKQIKNTFGRSLYSESDFINELAVVPFLFIDDFGTERVQKDGEDTWLQEKIYDVINKRYNSQKPTIFSSNLSIQELVEKQGIMTKTVDRVVELSNAIIEVKGDSYRFIKRNIDIPY